MVENNDCLIYAADIHKTDRNNLKIISRGVCSWFEAISRQSSQDVLMSQSDWSMTALNINGKIQTANTWWIKSTNCIKTITTIFGSESNSLYE